MTWTNRFKLLNGLIIVVAIVAAATLMLNKRESQVASTSASIEAISYSVGSDYAGTVVKQSVKQGDTVKTGDPLLTIQSASLMSYISTLATQDKTLPTTTAYTVGSDGLLTLIATQPGVVSTVRASVGGFVGAGQTLATINRSKSLYTLAKFKLDPYDFSRIEKGAEVEIVLPDTRKVLGKVAVIRVDTVAGKANAVVEVRSTGLKYGGHDGLIEPGTPVTAIMHLRDDGPLSGVTNTFQTLLLQVGL